MIKNNIVLETIYKINKYKKFNTNYQKIMIYKKIKSINLNIIYHMIIFLSKRDNNIRY